ncbi:CUE domain-containing protein [Plasmodiophora brassicae]
MDAGSAPLGPRNAWSRPLVTSSTSVSQAPPVGSPATGSSPLLLLRDMFPQADMSIIADVYSRSGNNPSVCAEMLLSLEDFSPDGVYGDFAQAPGADGGGPGPCSAVYHDPFLVISVDVMRIVAKFLTMFDLANLASVNREFKRLSEHELCSVTILYNAKHFRTASDERIVRMLTRFPRLTAVSLYKCTNFASFALLPVALRGSRVASLNLAFCTRIEDIDVRTIIIGFPTLAHLDLSSTPITDDALEYVAAIAPANLNRLVLCGCKRITDYGISLLNARCSALEQLDLRSTHIRPSPCLDPVENGAQLTVLYMSSCKTVSRVRFDADFAALQTLVLSSNPNMTEAVLRLPSLALLNLSSSKQLARLVVIAPRLRILNVSGCQGLTDGQFEVEALTKANLYNCRSIAPASLLLLFSAARQSLQDVDLRGCVQLQDDEALTFATMCTQIARFDVTGCRSLSALVVAQIGNHVATVQERIRRQRSASPAIV